MALFSWHNVYSVGVDSIDSQHKKLFDVANQFYEAHSQGQNRVALQGLFDELIKYTQIHFADEERLMQECGYPGYLKHKSQHEKLVQLVSNFRDRFVRGEPNTENLVMDFIKMWLNGHILGSDKAYQPYLGNRAQ